MVKRGVASLAILGSYPPPYGGVAIHVQRLCPLLEARGISYVAYNATSDVGDGDRVIGVYSRRRTWLLRYLFTAKEPVIYMMSGRLVAWVIGALMASLRGKRVILRLGNASLPDWIAQSWWRRFWVRFSVRRMETVICVSEYLVEAVRSAGADPKKLLWVPGFLPPTVDSADRDEVSPEVWKFAEKHGPLIAANGKVDWYDGQDLYGLDLLVELTARLKDDYPNIGVVICFWDHRPNDSDHLDSLLREASDRGIHDNILFNTKSGLFVPVMAASDVFVRPTNTDGDANSVREGLYLGIPTVASDAAERPPGTILFRNRDMDDFEAKVRAALQSNGKTGERRSPLADPKDLQRIEAYLDRLAALTGRCTEQAVGAR